jgi:anthranilate/para-aminobenzoate synthase component I
MHLDAQGNLHASVSIRTAHIWGDPDPDHPERVVNARFNYPVGAGIVADSDPQSEWEETLTKARILGSIVRVPLEIDGVKV